MVTNLLYLLGKNLISYEPRSIHRSVSKAFHRARPSPSAGVQVASLASSPAPTKKLISLEPRIVPRQFSPSYKKLRAEVLPPFCERGLPQGPAKIFPQTSPSAWLRGSLCYLAGPYPMENKSWCLPLYLVAGTAYVCSPTIPHPPSSSLGI